MSPFTLMAAPSPSSSSSLSTCTLLNPITLLVSPVRREHRRRFRVSIPCNSSLTTSASSSDSQQPTYPTQTSNTSTSSIFGGKKELKGIQVLVDKLSPPVRLATSAVIVAGALAAGYGLGLKFGGTRNAAVGGAVALGAASGAAAYAVNACAPEVAAISLYNYVAEFDDPTTVKKEDIEGIAANYGVSKQDETFNAELCDIYSEFVSSVLPPGGQDLKGDEVERIKIFKSALAIDDPDAAAMHVEVGRKIFRQRLEAGKRDTNIEERRAFQKLIYVSKLVFGDAASFLLPWKRIFKVSDAQIEVAIRDNAQRLYSSALISVSRGITADQLIRLREAQLKYGLSDETAEYLFRERTRRLVEENVLAAASIQKSRIKLVKGVGEVVEQLDKILEFNNRLILLKNHSEADRFAPGVGPVSLLGGDFADSGKMDDLKLLYKAYVTDSLSEGHMEDSKLAALNQLRNIFGLGKRDAEAITFDVISKVYRKRLAQVVTSGDLETADSKAAFIQNLCDELHFHPQKASQIHDVYPKKLQLCVADGELNDEDVAALLKLRVILCIPQQTVETAHADICGSIFEEAVTDAQAYCTTCMSSNSKDKRIQKLKRTKPNPVEKLSYSKKPRPTPLLINPKPYPKTKLQALEAVIDDVESSLDKGIRVDVEVFTSLLETCYRMQSLQHGVRVHRLIPQNIVRRNAGLSFKLVRLYASFGFMDEAHELFDQMSRRDISAFPWNSLISGYAEAGQYEDAMALFFQMMEDGVEPDVYTFPRGY